MKKRTIIPALLICSSIFASASAQEKTSFGIKLGANLTNVKLSEAQGAKFNPGASLSGFVNIPIGDFLSIQPELGINYTQTKLRLPGGQAKYRYASFEIPVYLQGEIKAGSGKLMLGVGPHIGYGLSADTKWSKTKDENVSLGKAIELDHWYAGGGATVGYEFANRMSVNAGYQMGFDFSSRHKSSSIKTQTIRLGIGYRF